MTARHR